MRRMTFLSLLVLAGVLATPVAAAPDGFRDSVRLSPIAAEIAGKPAAVYCARSFTAWDGLIRPLGGDPAKVPGYVPPSDDVAYLNTTTCQRLEGWLRGKNIPKLEQFGWSVLTLVHESMHMRGLDDEGETDCAALAEMPRVLRVHFKVRKPLTLRYVLAAAWRKHKLSGPAYQGTC